MEYVYMQPVCHETACNILLAGNQWVAMWLMTTFKMEGFIAISYVCLLEACYIELKVATEIKQY